MQSETRKSTFPLLFQKIILADNYLTISTPAEGLYKDKGSKFLAFAIPVSSLSEIKTILEQYRKKYYDARHVCYAYMLGADRLDFRANDDGEPSGTAGKPILGQINSRSLTNVLVIVVRYFGGILLGTSGLITAYKQAAADALDAAEIIQKEIQLPCLLHFEYPFMNDVMRAVKEENARILQSNYETDCRLDVLVNKAAAERFRKKIENIGNGAVRCEFATLTDEIDSSQVGF